MPTIAVDIDEVLAHHNRSLARFHNATYGTDHTEVDYVSDYWGLIWQVDAGEAERRTQEFHNERWHRRFEPIAGARQALERLAERHTLVVVTIRRRVVVDDTKDWLDEHFAKLFSDVRFIGRWDSPHWQTKADACLELGARYLIDDGVEHCTLAAAAGIQALLFGDYPWNDVSALPDGVRRVPDWASVVDYFDQL